eukprot:1354871-Amphidinium_carterae.1
MAAREHALEAVRRDGTNQQSAHAQLAQNGVGSLVPHACPLLVLAEACESSQAFSSLWLHRGSLSLSLVVCMLMQRVILSLEIAQRDKREVYPSHVQRQLNTIQGDEANEGT